MKTEANKGTSMTKDEALRMALEALEYAEAGLADIGDADREPGDDLAWCERRAAQALPKTRATITAIREALAQPEQEPVEFYVYKPTLPRGNLGNVSDGDLPWVYDQDPSSGYSARMLVYTTPPHRKPPQFPTMLRKMWSGTEVQEWINENWSER